MKGPRTKLKEGYKILSSDLLEVLKAPVEASVSTAKGKGDSLAVSISEGTTIKSSTQNSSLMKNAISFLKENALIIVSVPLFCLSLFLVYIFLAVLVQVWKKVYLLIHAFIVATCFIWLFFINLLRFFKICVIYNYFLGKILSQLYICVVLFLLVIMYMERINKTTIYSINKTCFFFYSNGYKSIRQSLDFQKDI